MMKCTDPKLGQQLALISDEPADAERADAIRRHLEECASCKEQYTVYHRLLGDLKRGFKRHVSADDLLLYSQANEPPTLSAEQKREIASHLLICTNCERALGRLKNADALLDSSGADQVIAPPDWTKEREEAFVNRVARELSAEKAMRLADGGPARRAWASLFFDKVADWLTSHIRILVYGFAAVLVVGLGYLAVAKFLLTSGEQVHQTGEQIQERQVQANPSPSEHPSPSPTVSTPIETPKLKFALNDGGQLVGVDEEGNIQGLSATLPATYQQLIKAALVTQKVQPAPLPKELTATGPVLGGPPESVPFTLVAPAGKIIPTTTPTFEWNELAGATDYVITVFDSNYRPVAINEKPVRGTQWTLPPQKALRPGEVYSWKVTAKKGSEELSSNTPAGMEGKGPSEAKFKVLDRTKLQELSMARKNYGNSHLLLGILYAQAGLLDEARQEFRALLLENPNSKIAQNLLHNLKSHHQ